MIAHLIATGAEETVDNKERWRPEGRPVRLGLITWPTVVFVGATVAAGACLMGVCDGGAQTLARTTRVGHSGTVHSIAYRNDGAVFSSVGVDGSIVIWGVTKHTNHPFLPEGPAQVRSAAFSPDNRVLATGKLTAAVELHDLVEGESQAVHDPVAATAGAACLAFTADGATLVVGQQDGRVSLWDSSTGRKRKVLAGHTEFVATLAMAQDGMTLASSGGDHAVRIWDLPTGRQRFSIQSPATTFDALSISPDGRLLVLADQVNPVVRIWDLTTEAEQAVLRGPAGAVVAVAICHDGSTLAAADYKGFVTLWDLPTLKIRPKRVRHSGVRSLAFAPDGRALATGGFDGTIHFWDFPLASSE